MTQPILSPPLLICHSESLLSICAQMGRHQVSCTQGAIHQRKINVSCSISSNKKEGRICCYFTSLKQYGIIRVLINHQEPIAKHSLLKENLISAQSVSPEWDAAYNNHRLAESSHLQVIVFIDLQYFFSLGVICQFSLNFMVFN